LAAGKKMTENNPSKQGGGTERNLKILVEQVGKIVSEISGKPIPEKSADLATLGMDSMAKLEVLARLEERFDIVLNESVVEEFHSIGHIAKIIKDIIRSTTTS
jgi:acyl carrier protein